MKDLKWRKRLMAGILCAAMVFQNMSVSALASEQETAATEEESEIVESEMEDDSSYSTNMAAEEDAVSYADTKADTGSTETSTENSTGGADSDSPEDPTIPQKTWTLGIDKPTLTIDKFTVSHDKGNDEATVMIRSLDNLSDEEKKGLEDGSLAITYTIDQRPAQKTEEGEEIPVIEAQGEGFGKPVNNSAQMKIKAVNAGKATINVTIGSHTKSVVVTVKNIDIEWNYEVGSTTLVTLDGLNITGTEKPPYWDESKKTSTIHISSGADLIPGNIIFGYNLDTNGVEHDNEVIKVSDFKGPITDKNGKYYEAKVEALKAGISEISITIGNVTRKITFVVEEIDSIVFDQHSLQMKEINGLAEVHLTVVPIKRWEQWLKNAGIGTPSTEPATENPSSTENSSSSEEASDSGESSGINNVGAKTLYLFEEAPETDEGLRFREFAETVQTPDSGDNTTDESASDTESASNTESTESTPSTESSPSTETPSSTETSSDTESSSTEESSDTGSSGGGSGSGSASGVEIGRAHV